MFNPDAGLIYSGTHNDRKLKMSARSVFGSVSYWLFIAISIALAALTTVYWLDGSAITFGFCNVVPDSTQAGNIDFMCSTKGDNQFSPMVVAPPSGISQNGNQGSGNNNNPGTGMGISNNGNNGGYEIATSATKQSQYYNKFSSTGYQNMWRHFDLTYGCMLTNDSGLRTISSADYVNTDNTTLITIPGDGVAIPHREVQWQEFRSAAIMSLTTVFKLNEVGQYPSSKTHSYNPNASLLQDQTYSAFCHIEETVQSFVPLGSNGVSYLTDTKDALRYLTENTLEAEDTACTESQKTALPGYTCMKKSNTEQEPSQLCDGFYFTVQLLYPNENGLKLANSSGKSKTEYTNYLKNNFCLAFYSCAGNAFYNRTQNTSSGWTPCGPQDIIPELSPTTPESYLFDTTVSSFLSVNDLVKLETTFLTAEVNIAKAKVGYYALAAGGLWSGLIDYVGGSEVGLLDLVNPDVYNSTQAFSRTIPPYANITNASAYVECETSNEHILTSTAFTNAFFIGKSGFSVKADFSLLSPSYRRAKNIVDKVAPGQYQPTGTLKNNELLSQMTKAFYTTQLSAGIASKCIAAANNTCTQTILTEIFQNQQQASTARTCEDVTFNVDAAENWMPQTALILLFAAWFGVYMGIPWSANALEDIVTSGEKNTGQESIARNMNDFFMWKTGAVGVAWSGVALLTAYTLALTASILYVINVNNFKDKAKLCGAGVSMTRANEVENYNIAFITLFSVQILMVIFLTFGSLLGCRALQQDMYTRLRGMM